MADVRRTALALGVVLLPFWANGLRFTPHEPHHEGLVALLGLVALATVGRPAVRREAWPLAAALGLGALSWALSAGLALSPALAVAGTSYRGDGLALQVGLFGAVALGWGASVRVVGRWLWGAALLVSVVVLAQWGGWLPLDVTGPVPRPVGTLGKPPIAAGWLTLALVWAALARPQAGPRGWRVAYGAGLLVIAFAILLTGTRGAVLALAAAGGVAVLLDRRAGRTMIWAALGAVVVIGAAFTLHQVRPIPVIDRLDEQASDYSNRFRARLWANTLTIARFAQPVRAADLSPDPRHPLRPLVGYGPGHFERLHRPDAYADRYFGALYAENKVIDFAHNDWLDALVTGGWAGWGARLALWLAVYTVALRRLRVFRPLALVWPLAFGGLGVVALWGMPWVVLGGTAGLLLGMAVGVLHRARPPAPDLPARLALLLLAAHLVDLQFAFVVVANTWPFWLMLGALLADGERPLALVDVRPALLPAGVLLLREWGGGLPTWAGLPALDAALVAVPVVWAVLGGPPRRAWRAVRVGVALLAGGSYLAYDTHADIRYGQGGDTVAAADARPWDVPLQAQAALVQLSRDAQAGATPGTPPALGRLGRLHPYEPQLAFARGWAAWLAGDPAAVRHLAAAHLLVPGNPTYCGLVHEICER